MGDYFKSMFTNLTSNIQSLVQNAANPLDGTSSSSPTSDNQFVGQTVDLKGQKIHIDRVIAEGGFGFVFKVHDVDTGLVYALKRLIAASDEVKQEVVNEIEVLQSLQPHPHIMQFHTWGLIHNNIYLILTEFCGRGTLLDLKIPLTIPDQLHRVMYQTGLALKRVHDEGIIHRDIKVENILFDSDGFVKLCDFGSATKQHHTPNMDWTPIQRSIVEDEMQRHTTPMYRPPEILDTYLHLPISVTMDLWAYGCFGYLIKYGKHPFEDSAKLRIINCNYTFPPGSDMTDPINSIIHRCLQIDPSDRPPITDILQELESNYSNLTSPCVGSKPSPPKPPSPSSGQHPPAPPAPPSSSNKSPPDRPPPPSRPPPPAVLPRGQTPPPPPPPPPRSANQSPIPPVRTSSRGLNHQVNHHQQQQQPPPQLVANLLNLSLDEEMTSYQLDSLDPLSGHDLIEPQGYMTHSSSSESFLTSTERSGNQYIPSVNGLDLLGNDLQSNPIDSDASPEVKVNLPASDIELLADIFSVPTVGPTVTIITTTTTNTVTSGSSGVTLQSLMGGGSKPLNPTIPSITSRLGEGNLTRNTSTPNLSTRPLDPLDQLGSFFTSSSISVTSTVATSTTNAPSCSVAGGSSILKPMVPMCPTPSLSSCNLTSSATTTTSFNTRAQPNGSNLPHHTFLPPKQPQYSRSFFTEVDTTTSNGSTTGGTGIGPKVKATQFEDLLSGFTKSSLGPDTSNMTMGQLKKAEMVKSGSVDPNRLKVMDWKENKTRNIRALLGSLDTVIWDGCKWTPVGMHQLVEPGDVKRHYHKACLAIHPDKLRGDPNEELAKLIFVELNDAWGWFEKQTLKS